MHPTGPKSEGGVFEGTEKDAGLSIMKLIAEYNPFLLDIEYSTMIQRRRSKFQYENPETNVTATITGSFDR